MAMMTVGGLVGALALISTPAAVFADIVPFLILASVVALAAEPCLSARIEDTHGRHRNRILVTSLTLIAVYTGYCGVMVLTVLLVLVQRHLAKPTR
jgi:uncharacterized protein